MLEAIALLSFLLKLNMCLYSICVHCPWNNLDISMEHDEWLSANGSKLFF